MTLGSYSLPSKLALLGALYFSQGLPFGFFSQALPVILRKSGFSLGEIGLSSLLALPWAVKFLWAPVIDRHHVARLGPRKSWILPMQGAAVVVLTGLASFEAVESMRLLMVSVFLLNLFAATQDIATDGLAVDMLAPEERGFANGLQVAGYRLGMIVGGGALLILYDALGASSIFAAMAALTALSTLPILFAREPQSDHAPPPGPSLVLRFLRRPGTAGILLLLSGYKAGDAFGTSMLRPFLTDAGLSLADIGWLLGTVGFIAGLVGALVGGALVNRLGRRRALLVFGVLQAVAIAGYAYLAYVPWHPYLLYSLCAFEHLTGGMATAALFTCMMDWCSEEASATDYTVQASVVVIASGAAAALSGFSAQWLGYSAHFVVATVLSFAAVVLVKKTFPTSL